MDDNEVMGGSPHDCKPDWHDLAATISIDSRPFLNGRRVDLRDPEVHTLNSPVDATRTVDVPVCGPPDVDFAVTSASKAFQESGWKDEGQEQRRSILLKLADLIESNRTELALLETLDMGKPVSEALNVDIMGAAATFRFYAEAIEKGADEIPQTPAGSTALVTKEPLGVVAAITPWNYPLEIAAWKIAPALAAGNAVVHKPSMEALHSSLFLADLAAEAGVPAGVLSVVTGSGRKVGDALSRHNLVDVLAFTGSTDVAKQLMVAAGQSNLKRVSLEAGGKSANIIFDDCEDLGLAAEKAAFGAFYNQGEVCSANSRILVSRSIFDDFMKLFVRAASEFNPGDPLNGESRAGAMVSSRHADKVCAFIDAGTRDGDLVYGGERISINGSDAYVKPTILTSLDSNHALNQTEIFGPVAVVMPFDDEDEAIRLANKTEFGLAASVWTSSLSRALRVSSKLVAGTVSVNTVDALGLTTPFGGFKGSGFGRDLSLHALDNYTDLKTTWLQWG